MPAKARRHLLRCLHSSARRALQALCLLPVATTAPADNIVEARYANPTDRYAHGVLGDAIEYGALVLSLSSGAELEFILPDHLVFEDTTPRLADLDGDARNEVIVVESDRARGARLAIYGAGGRITATPHIGTRFRWLAPIGMADLDADGAVELAYVDRPHLAKTLRIWRYKNAELTELASFAGVTNHRIGEEDIAGGIRDCGKGPEMILADANWRSLLALRFDGQEISLQQIGRDTSRAAFGSAMGCNDR